MTAKRKQTYRDYQDLMMNGSNIKDWTAYKAIKSIEEEERDAKFKKLLRTIFATCELSDFEVVGRIEIKDHITGKVYR